MDTAARNEDSNRREPDRPLLDGISTLDYFPGSTAYTDRYEAVGWLDWQVRLVGIGRLEVKAGERPPLTLTLAKRSTLTLALGRLINRAL